MFALFVFQHLVRSHKLPKSMLFQIERGKVALISGGGSGHEPFCAGYIGESTFDKLNIKYQAKTNQNYGSYNINVGPTLLSNVFM